MSKLNDKAMTITNQINFKFLFTLLFFSFLAYGQQVVGGFLVDDNSQIVNGINFNGPNGFKKIGDLLWKDGDTFLNVTYMQGVSLDKDGYKSICKRASRATEFIGFQTFPSINGKSFDVCFQGNFTAENLLSQMIYEKDGNVYYISVTTKMLPKREDGEIKEYEIMARVLGYMAVRMINQGLVNSSEL